MNDFLQNSVYLGLVLTFATYGIGMLVGTMVGGIPLILISAMAGTLTGKFVSKTLFSKSNAQRKLDELKQQLYLGIHQMVQEMRTQRELENWVEKLVADNFRELSNAMDAECERLLLDSEASMESIRRALTDSELRRRQTLEGSRHILDTLEKIRLELKPVVDRLARDLEQ